MGGDGIARSRKMKIKQLVSKRVICICIVGAVPIALSVLWQCQFYHERIVWTRGSLFIARDNVDKFNELEGRNPFSLAEINQYARAQVIF